MREVSRRDTVKLIAAGAASLAAVAAATGNARADDPVSRSDKMEADVRFCSSSSSAVHLTINSRLAGWAPVDAKGLAIAAACEAAGRKVWLTYGSHVAGGNGGGRFEDVRLAVRKDTV